MRLFQVVLALAIAGRALAAEPDEEAPVEGEAETSVDEDMPNPEPEAVQRKGLGFGISFNDDMELRWWRRPERAPGFPDREVYNYVELVNRFSLFVNKGRFSGWAQTDQVALFFNRYKLDGRLIHERELLEPGMRSITPEFSYINLEKVAVTYKGGDLDVTAGDFYAAFGRGGVLNLNRNVDIDIDTSIQGIKAVYRPGDWAITGLMGQLNRQQVFQDNPNILIGPDRRHAIAGLSIERYGVGPATIGLHGSAVDFVNEGGFLAGFRELGSTPDVIAGGATVEMMTGPVDWAGEVVTYGFPTRVAWGGAEPCGGNPRCLGYAGYVSATVYAGIASILFEGKRYKDSERINAPLVAELYEIAILPKLEYEPALTEDSAYAFNNNDIWGGLARIDVQASDSVMPYFSMMVSRDLSVAGFSPVPETILHPLTGVEFIDGESSVLVNGGWRTDLRDGTGFGFDRQVHGDIQAKIPLFKGFFLAPQVNIEHFKWGVVSIGGGSQLQLPDYVEMESALSVMKGSQFAATWFTDYTTNPAVGDKGNLSENWFGAVELQYKPTPAWTLKAFYGAYKPGIRCAGGQCRVLPGFNGARVAVTGAF